MKKFGVFALVALAFGLFAGFGNFFRILATDTTVRVASAPFPGQIYEVQPMTTLRGIINVLSGDKCGSILSNGNGSYLITWAMGHGRAFVAFSESGLANKDFLSLIGGKANLANYDDLAEIEKMLLKQGWKTIPATAMSKVVQTAIVEAAISSASFASTTMISVIVVPVGVLPEGVIQEYH